MLRKSLLAIAASFMTLSSFTATVAVMGGFTPSSAPVQYA